MRGINYAPVLRDMTWSYSRIRAFSDCPHRFYLRYVLERPGRELFLAGYGKLVHRLLERYYREELRREQLPAAYLAGFAEMRNTAGAAPGVNVCRAYFQEGLRYFREFEPLALTPAAVEQRVPMRIGKFPFVGVIDLVGIEENGDIVIVDNKSRKLKTPSRRAVKARAVFEAEVDEMLTQLYLYATAVEIMYGRLPAYLALNSIRSGELIRVPFDAGRYEKAVRWAEESVGRIIREDEFDPDPEPFKCQYLCEMGDFCEYRAGWR